MQKSHKTLKTQGSDPEAQTLLHTPSPSSPPSPGFSNPSLTSNITSSRTLATILKTTLLTSVIWTLFLTILLLFFTSDKQKDLLCIAHASFYSPLIPDVPAHWHTQRFNGSLLRLNVFRGDAGPDVDAAWEGLGVSYRSVLVPASEAKKSGIREDQVRVTERYGGGYPANVEGLHHLHCLNLLRKSLQWNYGYYQQQGHGAFSNEEYIVRYHVTHCLDILRQQLMCAVDIGVLGQVWWKAEDEEFPQPFVDFNTKHRCRDFEGVRDWAEKHQMPPETEVDMVEFYQMPRAGDTVYSEIP